MKPLAKALFGFFLLSGLVSPVWALKTRYPVAFITSLASSDPNTGRELKKGLDLFFKLHPAAKKDMEISFFENSGSPETSYEIIKQNSKKFVAFVGISRSDEALAASRAAEEEKVLFVTPFATNNGVTAGKTYTYRGCFSDDQQAQALASFIEKKFPKKKTLVLTNAESLYSRGLSESLLKSVRNSKNFQQAFYTSSLFMNAVDEVRKMAPEVLFLPDHVERAAALVKTLIEDKKMTLPVFVGGDGWGGKTIFHAIQAPTPGLEFYYSTHWDRKVGLQRDANFVRSYEKQYPDMEASSGAALSHDVLLMLWKALKSLEGKKVREDSLAKAYRAQKIQGSVGPVSYASKSENSPRKPVVIMKVKDARYSVERILE